MAETPRNGGDEQLVAWSSLVAVYQSVLHDVVQALEKAGHVVKREQSLWPIELQDGRRLVVPVEQIEVQNVEYQ